MRRNLYSGPPGVPSEPTAVYSEHCPFCGADFDPRDLGQVLEHYDHQVAAGVPAIDETPREEQWTAASHDVQGHTQRTTMTGTRGYSIEIKDIETGQTVVLMAADWDENDRRIAVAQIMRLAGVPESNYFLDEVAPKPEPGKV